MPVERIRVKSFVKRLNGAELEVYDGPSTDKKHLVGKILLKNEIIGRNERYWAVVIDIPEGAPFAVRDHNEDCCDRKPTGVLRSQRGFSRLCEIGFGGPKMLPCELLVPPRGCTYDGWNEETRDQVVYEDREEEINRLNEYIDAHQLIVNQFAFTDGKYWWKGEDLNEMKQKAEAFDAVKEWCLMFNQCIDSEAVKKKLYEILFPDEVDDLFKEPS